MKSPRALQSAFWAALLLFSFCVVVSAAERVEKMDANGDGKTDTWIYYDSDSGSPGTAKKKPGAQEPSFWDFAKRPTVTKREWDRNRDGKPDFRIIMQNGHVIEKQYDDNFDGTFERTVKIPRKGQNMEAATA